MRASASLRRALVLLGATVFLASCFVSQPRTGWNVNSRLGLVFAVVDEGRLNIDSYHDQPPTETYDKAFFEGHHYSDKIIGQSLIAVPVYAVIRGVSNLFDVEPDFQLTQYLLTRVTVSIPAALAAVLMALLFVRLGARPRRAILTTSGVFFGSMLFGFSTVFIPYLPGVASCLGALLVLRGPPLTSRRAALFGGLSGLALLFDLTFNITVAVLGVLFLVELRKLPRERWLRVAGAACGAAAVPLTIFLAYSVYIFGSPTIPYSYLKVEYFREGMSQGVMGVTAPKLHAVWFLTVHAFRGILFWSPWLLAAIVCCVRTLRRRDDPLRLVAIASLVTLLAYLLFNAGYYQWWAGSTMGPRLMIPMFAIVPLGLAVACRPDAPRWLWRSLMGTLAVSVALSLPISMVDPQTGGGNSEEVLINARVGTRLVVPQLNVLSDFYGLRWADLKQPVGIPVTLSLLLCLLVVVGGTTWAFRTADA